MSTLKQNKKCKASKKNWILKKNLLTTTKNVGPFKKKIEPHKNRRRKELKPPKKNFVWPQF